MKLRSTTIDYIAIAGLFLASLAFGLMLGRSHPRIVEKPYAVETVYHDCRVSDLAMAIPVGAVVRGK